MADRLSALPGRLNVELDAMARQAYERVIVSTLKMKTLQQVGLIRIVKAYTAGDYTQTATPVPIPNTAVKRLGPMVVRKGESRLSPAKF